MPTDEPNLGRHQIEIERNRQAWERKPILREIYGDLYRRMLQGLDSSLTGPILEIGSGLGALKAHCPTALLSDLFPNPWLDLVTDGYRLPFGERTLSHVLMLDVFHHLQSPFALLEEVRRVLEPRGRLILCEPYMSLVSWFAYELFHHEPVGGAEPIDPKPLAPARPKYYAAQGNATRIFFRDEMPSRFGGWSIVARVAFASFGYLLSGGFSKPALYPCRCWPLVRKIDARLSYWPKVFGARCLVVLQRDPSS